MNKLFYTFLICGWPLALISQQHPATGVGLKNEKPDKSSVCCNNGPKDSTEVKLTVFLQGPFDKGKMSTELNKNNLLPLSQPYNQSPWNYFGNEAVVEIPNLEVVDWILVEVRSAASPGGAVDSTIIARKAGFLMSDGSIYNIDGSSLLSFDTVFS